MTKKELEKLIGFFYDGGAIYRLGNYDLPKEVALMAAYEFLKHGVDLLSEYDTLKSLYFDCHNAVYDHAYRLRIDEKDALLWRKAVEKENFWNIEAIYDEEQIEFITSVVDEDCAYHENERQYKKRRKRASAYTLNPKLRKRIFDRDGNKCKICGSTDWLEVDHIVSVRKGGGNEDENLQTLCHSCNARKGDK